MSYHYEDFKNEIFTEKNQGAFLTVRDNINHLLDEAGAVSMQTVLKTPSVTADTWLMMAFVDRLVELGEIKEVNRPDIIGQYRIFVRPGE